MEGGVEKVALAGRVALREEALMRRGVVSNVIDCFIECISGLAGLEFEEFTECKDTSTSERIVVTFVYCSEEEDCGFEDSAGGGDPTLGDNGGGHVSDSRGNGSVIVMQRF